MNMDFKRKLPMPIELKAMYPLSEEAKEYKRINDEEIRKIFTGESNKFLLIIYLIRLEFGLRSFGYLDTEELRQIF